MGNLEEPREKFQDDWVEFYGKTPGKAGVISSFDCISKFNTNYYYFQVADGQVNILPWFLGVNPLLFI